MSCALPACDSSSSGEAADAAQASGPAMVEAADAMVKWGSGVDPRTEHRTEWSDAYERFRTECRKRLDGEQEDGQPG